MRCSFSVIILPDLLEKASLETKVREAQKELKITSQEIILNMSVLLILI